MIFEHSKIEHGYARLESPRRDDCRVGRSERPLAKFRRSVCLCVFAGLLAGGCVQSLHPFCEKEHSIFDPKLVGVWNAHGGPVPGRWAFSRQGEEAAYRLEYSAGGEPDVFRVRLTRIGDQNYLDLSLSKSNDAFDELGDFAKLHLLPVHTVARIDLRDDTATISFLDPRWLEELLRAEPTALRHERKGPIVITASTRELRTFVEQHADDADAWRRKTQLWRQVEHENSPDE